MSLQDKNGVSKIIGKTIGTYNEKLRSNPFKTKAVTLVVLAILNEQIASAVAGDVPYITVKAKGKELKVPQLLSKKAGLLGLFALVVNTPFNHFGYQFLQKVVRGPATRGKRVLQFAVSCLVLTPVFCALFVGWVATMNNLDALRLVQLLREKKKDEFKKELSSSMSKVAKVFKSSYVNVVKRSCVSTSVFTALAQNFIPNELWSTFFALCYFVLGTYNNTRVKLQRKSENCEKKEE